MSGTTLCTCCPLPYRTLQSSEHTGGLLTKRRIEVKEKVNELLRSEQISL